ncbi:ParM/StbA family protein [Acidovorax sp.]|uniref:ParM/StbA family protein n=1 Tax=Acidovorax sp. TaxID=1872122 RepID=UPI0027B91593|nr:ParM/StbA family protein [Acidovorax sp.]
MTPPVIGFDLGHSACKLTFDTADGVRRMLFPSVACPAHPISSPTEAERAKAETVFVGGRDWFVGETARHQGKAATASGLNDRWVESEEFAALVALAKRRIESVGIKGQQFWIVGLPVGAYVPHRDAVGTLMTSILGEEARVLVVQQPDAAYFAHTYTRQGGVRPGVNPMGQSWAVVDVGYFTTDFVLYENGRYIESCSGRYEGVRVVAENVMRALETKGIKRQLIDIERSLVQGTIRHMGEEIDISKEIESAFAQLFSNIFDQASRLLGDRVELLSGVLVAGGPAAALAAKMKAVWSHTRVVSDEHQEEGAALHGPRFVISEGYYRYGKVKQYLENMNATLASAG